VPRYEIIQRVEMTLTHIVHAPDAAAANEEATGRSASRCRAINKRWGSVSFGDVDDDYVPALDGTTEVDGRVAILQKVA
jgi:hypothetical protein